MFESFGDDPKAKGGVDLELPIGKQRPSKRRRFLAGAAITAGAAAAYKAATIYRSKRQNGDH